MSCKPPATLSTIFSPEGRFTECHQPVICSQGGLSSRPQKPRSPRKTLKAMVVLPMVRQHQVRFPRSLERLRNRTLATEPNVEKPQTDATRLKSSQHDTGRCRQRQTAVCFQVPPPPGEPMACPTLSRWAFFVVLRRSGPLFDGSVNQVARALRAFRDRMPMHKYSIVLIIC
jgi:hypothetical protein